MGLLLLFTLCSEASAHSPHFDSGMEPIPLMWADFLNFGTLIPTVVMLFKRATKTRNRSKEALVLATSLALSLCVGFAVSQNGALIALQTEVSVSAVWGFGVATACLLGIEIWRSRQGFSLVPVAISLLMLAGFWFATARLVGSDRVYVASHDEDRGQAINTNVTF